MVGPFKGLGLIIGWRLGRKVIRYGLNGLGWEKIGGLLDLLHNKVLTWEGLIELGF